MPVSTVVDTPREEFELPPPIKGAQAWRGPDMVASDAWVHTTETVAFRQGIEKIVLVAEIEEAIRLLGDADIARITRTDFQLPNLEP